MIALYLMHYLIIALSSAALIVALLFIAPSSVFRLYHVLLWGSLYNWRNYFMIQSTVLHMSVQTC